MLILAPDSPPKNLVAAEDRDHWLPLVEYQMDSCPFTVPAAKYPRLPAVTKPISDVDAGEETVPPLVPLAPAETESETGTDEKGAPGPAEIQTAAWRFAP